MNTSLKRGLSFVAFGFLFTLVNLNLTLNGTTVSIRFTGTESLSRRLAEAFRAVVN